MPVNSLKNKNFYAYNAIVASRLNFSPNYSYLLTKLLQTEQDLASGSIVIDHIAENLVKVINNSNAFPHLDRICLSLTYPGSSRIAVLSSYNSQNLANNRMSTNYSCYVSSESSIFQTKMTNVRIYSDIDEIISHYEGRPVQRSLGLLQKMGVKSGVTIPVGLTPLVSAFLFMNSSKIGHFDYLNKEDYACLSLLKLIATNALNRMFLGDFGIDGQIGKFLNEQKQAKNTFNIETFTNLLEKAIKLKFNRDIKLKIQNHIEKDFLYAYNPLIFAIIKIISFYESNIKNLEIDINEQQIDAQMYVSVTLKNIALDSHQLQSLSEIKIFTNQDMIIGHPNVQLLSKLDETSLVDYSI